MVVSDVEAWPQWQATLSAPWRRISRSRTDIGRLLMDQEVLAGVGNVYRAEVLFRHGVDPHRPGRLPPPHVREP